MSYCRYKEQQREEWILLGPPHPAEVFLEQVWPRLGLTRRAFAAEIGMSVSTASKFLNRRKRVSPRLAAGLAALSGHSALYWLVLQARHDAWLLEKAAERKPRRTASHRSLSLLSTS